MPFLLALLLSLPFVVFTWLKTDAYASVKADGGRWARTAALRAALAALAFACAAQGAWTAWQARNADGQGGAPATMFLVDASASMLVLDAPDGASRLEYALNLARNWAERHPGAPVGLVAFGASAQTVIPRTAGSDASALIAGVSQVRSKAPMEGPEFVPGAVTEAARRAGTRGQVILLSDGGDQADGKIETDAAKSALEKAGVSLVVSAVGTQAGGRIPLRTDVFGQQQYKMFRGKEVIAQSTPRRLQDFSKTVGGRFVDAADIPALDAPGAQGNPSGVPWAVACALLVGAAIAPYAAARKKTSV